jgi:hypothetical protein
MVTRSTLRQGLAMTDDDDVTTSPTVVLPSGTQRPNKSAIEQVNTLRCRASVAAASASACRRGASSRFGWKVGAKPNGKVEA